MSRVPPNGGARAATRETSMPLGLSTAQLAERRLRLHAGDAQYVMAGDYRRVESLYMPEPNSGCWLWIGSVLARRGYGRIGVRGKEYLAHRLVYEMLVGPVPEGLELDHKCRVTCCVNPDHLEPVTHLENVRRGESGLVHRQRYLARTHCPHGHPWTPENTIRNARGHRHCRECLRMHNKGYRRLRCL